VWCACIAGLSRLPTVTHFRSEREFSNRRCARRQDDHSLCIDGTAVSVNNMHVAHRSLSGVAKFSEETPKCGISRLTALHAGAALSLYGAFFRQLVQHADNWPCFAEYCLKHSAVCLCRMPAAMRPFEHRVGWQSAAGPACCSHSRCACSSSSSVGLPAGSNNREPFVGPEQLVRPETVRLGITIARGLNQEHQSGM